MLSVFGLSSVALAQNYQVTITNVTKGMSFTPILVASHTAEASFGSAGAAASTELETLAEDGNVAPLQETLDSLSAVRDTAASEGLLAPGESTTITVSARRARQISLAAMLVPSNDTFVFLNGITAPSGNRTLNLQAFAYDSGTEVNDELCDSVAGPASACTGGAGANAAPSAGAEGFIHIASGIQNVGELSSATYDWRGPVANVSIRRARR